MSMSRKLWASVGFAVVATLPAAAVAAAAGDDATPALHRHAAPPATDGRFLLAAGESGEGGEAGEAGEEDAFEQSAPDAALQGRLLLVQGHVRVGRELVALGKYDEAMPHFHHPIEEIYTKIQAPLVRRGVTGFKASLDAASKAVMDKAPQAKTEAAITRVDKAVAAASAKIPAKVAAQPAFVFAVVAGLLQSAAGEYAEAVKDGKFVAVVEYQDGRGFLLEARDYLKAHEAVLKKKDAEGAQRLAELITELAPVWPAVQPPSAPVMGPGEVQALASRAELLKRRFD